jgi:hypothetical protein
MREGLTAVPLAAEHTADHTVGSGEWVHGGGRVGLIMAALENDP